MFNFFRKKRLTHSTPSEVIDKVVNLYIAPMLKSKGFKKTGRTWLKEGEDYSFLLNIQASRWNGRETGVSFAINYGVYVPSVYEALYTQEKPKSPKYYDCMLSHAVRSNKKGQIWWDIYDSTDLTKLGYELEEGIEEQCMGLFATIRSLPDVLHTSITKVDESDPWRLLAIAVLYAELNDQKNVQEAFRMAHRKSEGNVYLQARIVSAAKKYSISV